MKNAGDNSLKRFPLDVDFFRDVEIIRLGIKLGDSGILTLLKIFAWIYNSHEGYYQPWKEDSAILFALTECYSIEKAEEVEAVVKQAVACGIFDKRCFECFGILTSRRIQSIWLNAMQAIKRAVKIEPEYDLIEEEGPVKIPAKKGSSGNSPETSGKILENSGDFPESSGEIPETSGNSPETSEINEMKRNEIKNLLTNAREDFQNSAPPKEPDPERDAVRNVLIPPDDYTIAADLIDRICEARRQRLQGFDNASIRKIRRQAEESVQRYRNGDRRSGKPEFWKSIADAVQGRFSALGIQWEAINPARKEPPPTREEVARFEEQCQKNRTMRREAKLEALAKD